MRRAVPFLTVDHIYSDIESTLSMGGVVKVKNLRGRHKN